jgi:hypothetical protein
MGLRRVVRGQLFLQAQIIVMIERSVYDLFALDLGLVLRCHTITIACEHMPLARYGASVHPVQ